MGLAHLRSGERIDYKQYIESHPHWQLVRKTRFKFDEYRCVVCHRNLTGDRYETHHLSYLNLGDEHLTDVITLCPDCHKKFHRNWTKSTWWTGRESGHWDVFDINHTARMCAKYFKEDRFICKDAEAPNLCRDETDREYVERYHKEFELLSQIAIDPHDFSLFVRNKRYELLFDAERRGLSVIEFLDEYYGEKIRGKNPIRRDAEKFFTKHEVKSFHKHYSENKNINLLMKEAAKY